MSSTTDIETRYCAHGYHPLSAVVTAGEAAFARDDVGAGAALIDGAVARIQRLLGEMKPRRPAS